MDNVQYAFAREHSDLVLDHFGVVWVSFYCQVKIILVASECHLGFIWGDWVRIMLLDNAKDP